MAEMTIDIIIDVVIGKNNEKFFFWIYISPGSLPSQDTFAPSMSTAPKIIKTIPVNTINLPSPAIFCLS